MELTGLAKVQEKVVQIVASLRQVLKYLKMYQELLQCLKLGIQFRT